MSSILRVLIRLLVVGAFCGGILLRAAAGQEIHSTSALLRLIDQVDVPARAPGVLSVVHVVEGQAVKQGQVVALIDDTEARLLLRKAEIELLQAKLKLKNDVPLRNAQGALSYAEAAYQRLKDASKSLPGSVSESKLEEHRWQVDKALLDVEDVKRQQSIDKASQMLKENAVAASRRYLEIRKITAPISGIVKQVFRRPGEWVEPGDQVLHMIGIRRLRAEGFIRSDQVRGDLQGAPVKLVVDTTHDQSSVVPGRITFVHPEIDPVNSQLRIWAEVDNRAGLLRPGMHARITITPRSAERAHAAPPRAQKR